MKKRFLAILLSALMAMSLAACGGGNGSGNASGGASSDTSGGSTDGASAGEKYRVAYFNRDDTDEYLNGFCSGVETLCTADDSIEFTRYNGQADANKQLTQVEDALSKGVDLIILSAQDAETMVSKVKECNEKGIPVICIDISLTRGTCDFNFVGSNSYDLGYAEAEYMMEHLPENGKILYLRFVVGGETSRLRDEGIMGAIADSGRTDYEILSTMEYDGTIEDAMSKMEDTLQVYGDDWDAFIGHSDRALYGCISAMESAGLDPSTKLMCSIDGEATACQMIMDGRVSCSVKQDQAGIIDKTFELVKSYQNGEQLEPNTDYFIPGIIVDSSNAADYAG